MNYRYGGGLLASNKPMSQQDMALYNRYVKPAMQQAPNINSLLGIPSSKGLQFMQNAAPSSQSGYGMMSELDAQKMQEMTPQTNPFGFDVNENGEYVHPDGHVITPEMYQDMIERANPAEDTNFLQRMLDLYDEYMMKNAG
jgi:phosphoglycerol transferase MdoB-like AlkP superfamily enzyme